MMQRPLGAVTICILVGLLTLGLWSFNPHPRNEVSWLSKGNGLHFGEQGIIATPTPFHFGKGETRQSCSLEVWLQPAEKTDGSTPLAFYTPEDPLRFEILQYPDFLMLRHRIQDSQGRSRIAVMEVKNLLQPKKKVLLTIATNERKTAIYVDGRIVQSSERFGLTREELASQLVFGTSPVSAAPWHGDLLGLALYEEDLTEAEVAENYRSWIENGRPVDSAEREPAALYLFDERSGNVAHDKTQSGQDLEIPSLFSLLQKRVLARPGWNDLVRLSFWTDVLVNIGGFIPFGVFASAYLSSTHTKRAGVVAVMLGFAVSLTIELLQVLLPLRDSDMTDLITNTTGTILGVLLYRHAVAWTSRASQPSIEQA
jgi:VanZ like family/Concanavalin A-like lectin/glucanases superfamily